MGRAKGFVGEEEGFAWGFVNEEEGGCRCYLMPTICS